MVPLLTTKCSTTVEAIKTEKLKTFFDAQPVHVVFVVDKVTL
jgi:hypothetical protein